MNKHFNRLCTLTQAISTTTKATAACLTLALCINSGFGQNGLQHYVNFANNNLRKAFENLNPPTYSDKLYHMSIHRVDESRFVAYSDSVENRDLWFQMYSEMRLASYDTTLLPHEDTVFDDAFVHQSDTVPILLIDFEMHKFKNQQVFNSGYYFNFDTLNNILYDNPNRTATPYSQGAVFKGANFKKSVTFADPVFKVDPALIFIDAQNLPDYQDHDFQINFDDGTGFHSYSTTSLAYYQAQYNSAGVKSLTFRLVNRDGAVVKKSRSRFSVRDSRNAADFPLVPSPVQIPGLRISVVPSHCDDMPKKAFIYLTGFDLFKDTPKEDWYDRFLRAELNDLLDHGYDVYVVQYSDPYDGLDANAARVIDFIQALKCSVYANSDEQFVLLGYSMGGLIGRFALTQMELPGVANPDACKPERMHNVRLFISADAPQQGANIPLSIQHIYEFADVVLPLGPTDNKFQKLFKDHALNSMAARQMLQLHYSTKSGFDYDRHPVGQQFFSNLNGLGNYPKFCKNVSFSHGMMNGTRQVNLTSGITKPTQATLFDGVIRVAIQILWFNATLVEQSITAKTNPMGIGNIVDVESDFFKLKLDFSMFGVQLKQELEDWLFDRNANTFATCTNQGSYMEPDLPSFLDPTNIYGNWALGAWNLSLNSNGNAVFDLSGKLLGFEFLAGVSPQTDGFDFNFIPTYSALDINHHWTPHIAHVDVTQYSTSTIMNNTPFDVIVGGDHANASPYNIPWPVDTGSTTNPQTVTWDIDQNNSHSDPFRNENVIGNGNEHNGWLLREVGDEALWLENYKLAYQASFTATDDLKSGEFLFSHYNYLSQPQSVFMAGAYSKENPMQIMGAGNAIMKYNPNYGVYQDFGTVIHGQLTDLPLNIDFCPKHTSYANKTALSAATASAEQATEYQIYPNPATGKVFVELHGNEPYTLSVYSTNGNLVLSKESNNNSLEVINLDGLPSGVYVIQIQNDTQIITDKISLL